MIRYSLIFILGLAIAFGQKQTQENKPREKTAAVTIPADAVEVTPGVYKHTDSSGKNWIYRKTPFGLTKVAETPEAERRSSEAKPDENASPKRGNPFGDAKKASANSTAATVTAVEDGDMVRFERSTPFGPSRWSRKKSELTADEQEILERSRTAKESTGTKE